VRAAALGLVVALAACGSRSHEARPVAGDGGVITDGAAPPPAPERGFVGVLVAGESVDIAPRFGGRIASVHVRAGDRVATGDLIAEMDPAPLREEVRTAEAAVRAMNAALRQAELDVEEARRRVANEKAAVAAGTSPRQAYETAELALARSRAAADRVRGTLGEERSRLDTARSRLEDAALRAPFDATVALRLRDAGATIAAGAPIVRLVGRDELRLRFAVPPDRARELTVGGAVEATIETLAAPVPAEVRQVSPALDPASGMVLAEAQLDIDDATRAELRPGLAAQVRPR